MTKHAEDGKWVYSGSEEIYNTGEFFATKEEAIAAGKEDYTWEGFCRTFYVGQVNSVDFAIGVDVLGTLEHVSQNVFDEVGEVAEGYLYDVKQEEYKELEAELNEVLLNWMEKRDYLPSFFQVINIERVEGF